MKTPFLLLLLGAGALTTALGQTPVSLRNATAAQLRRLTTAAPASSHRPTLTARRGGGSVRVPGRAVRYRWSTANNAWESPTTIAYTYNSQAQLTQQVLADSATAEPLSRVLTTYNAYSAPTETREQYWNGTAWVDASRLVWTYDSHNTLEEERKEYFDSNGTSWLTVAGTHYLNTYNANNHLTAQVVQEYDSLTQGFVNKLRQLYVVPASGEWSQQTIQSWHSGWQDSARVVNAQWQDFAKDQMTSADIQQPAGGGQWVTFMRMSGSYSPALERKVFDRLDSSGLWHNYARFSTSYDVFDTMTDSRVESWDDQTSTWNIVIQEHHLPTYDAAGELRRRIDQVLIPFFTTGLENSERYHFYDYRSPLATQPASAGALALSAAPNPSADGRFELQVAGSPARVSVRVVDALGRPVWQRYYAGSLPASTNIDLSQQPAGVYMVEVRGEKSLGRLRVLVQ